MQQYVFNVLSYEVIMFAVLSLGNLSLEHCGVLLAYFWHHQQKQRLGLCKSYICLCLYFIESYSFRFPLICFSQHISEEELLQILCVSTKAFYIDQVCIMHLHEVL